MRGHIETPPRRARRDLAAGVLAVAMFALNLAAPGVSRAETQPLASAPQQSLSAVATLSNLTSLSRWAYPQAEAAAHEFPSPRSRVVGHLRFLTGDGQAALYLALRSYTTGNSEWILVPLPGRPNGVTGWVPVGALGEMHVTHEHLRVDRATYRITLYRYDHSIWSAPIGVGRPSLPTPAGHFYVTEKLTGFGEPLYGPYALGTSAYAPTLSEWPGGGIVGIHGTDEPQLIPGRPSHGCIRLRNGDAARLWHLVQVGTPIEVL